MFSFDSVFMLVLKRLPKRKYFFSEKAGGFRRLEMLSTTRVLQRKRVLSTGIFYRRPIRGCLAPLYEIVTFESPQLPTIKG